MCPDKLIRPKGPKTLKRDEEVVTEYDAKDVSGWCMEEVDE